MKSLLPVLTVVGAILLFWVVSVVPMNMHLTADQAQRDSLTVSPETPAERQAYSGLGLTLQNPGLISRTYGLERPRLPSPHQVGAEMWDTIFEKRITSRRSLVYHGWVTLSATLLGFVIGTGGGWHCLQQSDGYERDALGDCEPDHPDPRACADDHRDAWLNRDSGVVSEGCYQRISELFSRRRGYGQRLAEPRCDAGGPVAHL